MIPEPVDYYGFTKLKREGASGEGAEYEVLKGADIALRKTDFIVIELTRDVKDIVGLLLRKGFKIKRLKFSTYILAFNAAKIARKERRC